MLRTYDDFAVIDYTVSLSTQARQQYDAEQVMQAIAGHLRTNDELRLLRIKRSIRQQESEAQEIRRRLYG